MLSIRPRNTSEKCCMIIRKYELLNPTAILNQCFRVQGTPWKTWISITKSTHVCHVKLMFLVGKLSRNNTKSTTGTQQNGPQDFYLVLWDDPKFLGSKKHGSWFSLSMPSYPMGFGLFALCKGHKFRLILQKWILDDQLFLLNSM